MDQKHHYSIIFLLLILLSSITIPTINCEIISKTDMIKVGPSCTIFTVAVGDTVLFGNNEDYLQRDLYQWYIPSQNITVLGENKTIYGAVFVGFVNREEGGIYPQGGMNEHGLMYDVNGLPALAISENLTGSVCYSDYVLCTSLWNCKDVEEVIKWFKNHRWDGQVGGQIHYGDASGEAVVVSVNPSTSKWAFTKKNSTYIVSTNFNLNDTSNAHDYPCERYNTATQMLDDIIDEEDLTVQACADLLYAVHQEGMYSTLYSNIFDPVNLDLYFNYGDNYHKQKKINLLDSISQEGSFEKKYSFFGINGSQGHLLVKSVRLDENFYYPSSLLPVYNILTFIAICGICIPLGFYIHKKKKKITEIREESKTR